MLCNWLFLSFFFLCFLFVCFSLLVGLSFFSFSFLPSFYDLSGIEKVSSQLNYIKSFYFLIVSLYILCYPCLFLLFVSFPLTQFCTSLSVFLGIYCHRDTVADQFCEYSRWKLPYIFFLYSNRFKLGTYILTIQLSSLHFCNEVNESIEKCLHICYLNIFTTVRLQLCKHFPYVMLNTRTQTTL